MFFANVSKRQARDAARLALQSAIAAAGAFALMQTFGLPEKFVGVLSAVLVVQPSVGNTLWAGAERVVATLVGCAVGVICLVLLPSGYGTAAALGFSMLVMNAIAGFRPQWRYGVVAAVALSLGAESNALQTALERSIAIGSGVAFGVLVSLVVWPERSSTRARRHIRSALRAVASCLDNALRAAADADTDVDDKARDRYHREMRSARESAKAVRIADNGHLFERIGLVEQFYNAVLILNRVAEETDEIAGDSQDLLAKLDAIREQTCQIATDLADGNFKPLESHQEIMRLLDEVRARFVKARDDTQAHVLRNALVFGLNEVEDAMAKLLESYRSEYASE